MWHSESHGRMKKQIDDILLALYFIVKWAVKNGIKEAYRDIKGKVTADDIETEEIFNEEEE